MHERLAVLAAGIRRFLVLLAGIAVVTTLGALLLAFLAKWDVDRAVATGFDLVGAFLLVVGFFFGNRGPARMRDAWVPMLGPRRVRYATPREHVEALNESAIFVAVGFVLVVIGIAIDTRYRLV